MSAVRAKPPVFLTASDTHILYVKLRNSGLSIYDVRRNNMNVVHFQGYGKTQYVRVTEVIEWHADELRASEGQLGNETIYDQLVLELKTRNAN